MVDEMKESILLEEALPFDKEQLKIVVGMTFNDDAWQVLKSKFAEVDFDNNVFIGSIPCHLINKQEQQCIAWYNKEMMDLWIKAGQSEFIDVLSELKSKGSA
jgi:hypothetical protein